jgi:hypothetical protein
LEELRSIVQNCGTVLLVNVLYPRNISESTKSKFKQVTSNTLLCPCSKLKKKKKRKEGKDVYT